MRRTVLPVFAAMSLLVAACSKSDEQKTPAPAKTAAAPSTGTAHQHSANHSHSSPKAHADHDARHGGIVTMEGDNHVEIVVAADGSIDLYITDAVRKNIPLKGVTGSITIESVEKKEKQTRPLAEDTAKGSLSAKGPAPKEKTEYTWDLKVNGAPMKMTLRVPSGGTAAFEAASTHGKNGDHEHGSPHGGMVQPLGNDHVEVKLDKTGDVTLWALDDSEKAKPAKGWTATIRPVLPNAKDVKLDYDEKLDALRGKIDPVTQVHIDAIITVTPPGGSSSQLRFPFHFSELEGK